MDLYKGPAGVTEIKFVKMSRKDSARVSRYGKTNKRTPQDYSGFFSQGQQLATGPIEFLQTVLKLYS